MSDTAITELVAACAGLVGLAAFIGLVMVPVVSSYQRAWERVVAGVLSLWVLGAFVGVGVLAGAVVVFYWPRLF
jgi:NAD/NADP transhydrogenase beta subunit